MVKTSTQMAIERNKITLILAAPRGFCAGVARAVAIVEAALEKYGAPVFVRHQIVHNLAVVAGLEKLGAVFVESLDEIPSGVPAPQVIFSAHGVAPALINEARARGLEVLDATCPLVSKVHAEVRRHRKRGRHVFLIGHQGHPEIIGTIGHIGSQGWSLIETLGDAKSVAVADGVPCAYATQTTLSVSETAAIIAVLKSRFPSIATPNGEDICYATTNRQNAVRAIAPSVKRFFILGADNSSNAKRLVETARAAGATHAHLIASAADIPFAESADGEVWGLSAGASTPDFLVREVIDEMKEQFDLTIETHRTAVENITFPMPKALR